MLLDLDSADLTIAEVGAHFDALDPDQRWGQIRTLGRVQQRQLYQLASGARVDLTDLAPAAPLVEVIHDGVNTLPVPGALRRFQKRMCRPAVDADVLFGYNEGPLRR